MAIAQFEASGRVTSIGSESDGASEKGDVEMLMMATRERTVGGKLSRHDVIIAEAHERLARNSHLHMRMSAIRIDEHDGTLVLSGCLPSYYLKQILQTALRDLDGITKIRNDVEVAYPPKK